VQSCCRSLASDTDGGRCRYSARCDAPSAREVLSEGLVASLNDARPGWRERSWPLFGRSPMRLCSSDDKFYRHLLHDSMSPPRTRGGYRAAVSHDGSAIPALGAFQVQVALGQATDPQRRTAEVATTTRPRRRGQSMETRRCAPSQQPSHIERLLRLLSHAQISCRRRYQDSRPRGAPTPRCRRL